MNGRPNKLQGIVQSGQNGCVLESPDSTLSSLEEPCCSSPRLSFSDIDDLPRPTSSIPSVDIPSVEGITESWLRSKLRRATSALSGWRSTETNEAKSSTLKNKLFSAWNTIKYSEKWMNFANDDYTSDGFKKIVLLGLVYCPEDSECDCGMDFIDFYRDYYTRIWITYRTGMPPLLGTQVTTDCGWGCMIRTTQMALAQALVLNRLSRMWRYYGRKSGRKMSRADPFYQNQLDILRLFEDCPTAPLGIHRLVEISSKENPGVDSIRWYAPSAVISLMKKALRQSPSPLTSDLSILLAVDGRVVIGDTERESRAWAKRLLLFVPLRLGTSNVNPVYFDHIRHLFNLRSCLGILGGRPDHSLYFIGYYGRESCDKIAEIVGVIIKTFVERVEELRSNDAQITPRSLLRSVNEDKHVIYLDPHVAHEYVPMSSWDDSTPPPEQSADIVKKRHKHPISSYHCRSLAKLPMKEMDPSCVVGFMFRTKEEMDDAFRELNLNQVVDVDLGPEEGSKRTKDPLFTVQYQETASYDCTREVSEDERRQAAEHGFELL